MTDDLMQQGLMLMLVGMSTVFVFLTALVAAMALIAVVARRFHPEPPAANGVSAEEVAAITAAIATHRKR